LYLIYGNYRYSSWGYINQLETGGGHFAKGVQKKEYEIASRHNILCFEWNPFDSIPDSLF
jgi:hypothetical protein